MDLRQFSTFSATNANEGAKDKSCPLLFLDCPSFLLSMNLESTLQRLLWWIEMTWHFFLSPRKKDWIFPSSWWDKTEFEFWNKEPRLRGCLEEAQRTNQLSNREEVSVSQISFFRGPIERIGRSILSYRKGNVGPRDVGHRTQRP